VTERVEVSAPPANMDVTHAEVAVNVESRLVVDLPSVNRDITTLVEMVPGARQVQGITAGGSRSFGQLCARRCDTPQPERFLSGRLREYGSLAFAGFADAKSGYDSGSSDHRLQCLSRIRQGAREKHERHPQVRNQCISWHPFYATHATPLNANTWSANLAGSSRPTDVPKWMGGTLGGPVHKNHTFFFGSYQHFYDNDPSQQTGNRMPTQAMVNGDFGTVAGFSIKAINPSTGQVIGRIIPQSLINPISAKLAARIPTISQSATIRR